MFANVVRLELQKQKKDFLIIAGFAAIVMLCFLAEAVLKNRNLAEFVKDVFGFLSIGFVFVLAISGASSAYHLRREPYKSADEPLPFQPAHRTVGSYFVNLVYLLVGSSVFLIATYFFGAAKEISWIQPSLAILLIIHFHMLCFIFAYWLNHSPLAIVASALIVWCEYVLIEQRTFFFYFLHNPYVSLFGKDDVKLSSGSVFSLIAGFAGGLIALILISRRIEKERNLRWIPGVVASWILLIGTFLLVVDLLRTSNIAQTKLRPDYHLWTNELLTPTPRLSEKGVFLTSNIGSILYVGSDRRKVLRQVPVQFFSKPRQFDVVAIFENHETEELWTIIRNDESDNNDYGIWKSISGETLQLHSEFNSKGIRPSYIVKCKSQLCVYGYTPEKIAYARIDDRGLSPWEYINYQNSKSSYLGAIRNHVLQDAVTNGEVASLSPDNAYLTRNRPDGSIQKWLLPGKADLPSFMGSIVTAAFHKGGEPFFVVPVNNQGIFSLFVCNSDGTLSRLWNKSWTEKERLTWESLPGGGQGWILREAQNWKPIEALVVNGKGEQFPPFRIEITSEDDYFVDFMKRENSSVWILTDGSLARVDLQTGRTLARFKIEADESDWRNIFRSRAEEGVYFIEDDHIQLIDWNGKIKDLGPATLD